MRFFRTLSLTINTQCGMNCPHCDLPVYKRLDQTRLTPDGWEALLDKLLPVIGPDVVALAAREPLFDSSARDITSRVLQTAKKHGARSGLVTTGMKIETYFQEIDPGFRFDYMDISLEGMKEIDARSRGPRHFDAVERVLDRAEYKRHVDALYISTTMTAVNSSEKHLTEYFRWLLDHMDEPNIALLLLYPNQNVPESIALKGDDVERIIDMAASVSPCFNNIFLEVFPGSVPNLRELVEAGVLPGDDEVIRDDAGVLCGHVTENLMIRYITPHDLLKYHLRISPEGFAMSSGGVEHSDYLQGNYGNLLVEDLSAVQQRVADELAQEWEAIPKECFGKPCFGICRGSNRKCVVFQNHRKEMGHVLELCQ